MKYPKWISLGRKEKAEDDIASVDDLRDGSKIKPNHEGKYLKILTLGETSSPINVSSQGVTDTSKNVTIEAGLGLSDTKKPTVPSRGRSVKCKRKSWYSILSKKFEGCKPRASDQVSLYDQTGMIKDRMTTPSSIKHTRDDVSNTPPNNSITIIVTSPTSDVYPKQEDLSSSSSSASSLSLSSLSSLSSSSGFDTTRLMPPSLSPSLQKYPKSNEAPEVKKWLIGCMNRKADTLPRKLVYRMMEIYNIKEHELDPKMLEKLRKEIEDEGVVLQVDLEAEDRDKDKKREEFDGVEALRCSRASFRSQSQEGDGKEKKKEKGKEKEKKEGKGISGHHDDTVTTKRSSKNNNNNTNSREQNPPKKLIPGANPRVWQNPSSRARNWPTTTPAHSNISPGAPFSFPTYTPPHSKHRHSPKNNSHMSGSKTIYSTSNYSRRGICPPRRGSVISLSSIPEHGVSVGFGYDVKGVEERGVKARPKSIATSSVERKRGM